MRRAAVADEHATAALKLKAGQTASYQVDLNHTDSWYDVSVVVAGDNSFLRRFAGHVETGEEGVSDPGLITK